MQASAPQLTPAPPRWTVRRTILATLAVVGVAAGFYLLWRFTTVLFIVFIAAVLATALRPAVQRLEKRGVPPRLSILLLYLLLLAVVIGVIAALVPLLINQGSALVTSLPGYYSDMRTTLTHSSSLIMRNIGNRLPGALTFSLDAGGAVPDNGALLTQALASVRNLSWVLFGTLSVFLIAFFWALDREQIVKALLLIVPINRRTQGVQLWEEMERKVGGYIRGTAILCVSIGVLSGIAYFLIGVPSALIIAVLAGVLEAIPYVGPFLTAAIAIVVTLSQAPDKIVWVLAACFIIQQVENAVLVPRIMDRAVGVNAIVTLLAIAAFGSLLGVLGAIMAIPLAAVIQVLLDYWVLNADTVTPPLIGRDKVAALRYQAQDLAQDLRGRIRRDDAAEGTEPDDIYEERIETLVGDLDLVLAQLSTAEANIAPGGTV